MIALKTLNVYILLTYLLNYLLNSVSISTSRYFVNTVWKLYRNRRYYIGASPKWRENAVAMSSKLSLRKRELIKTYVNVSYVKYVVYACFIFPVFLFLFFSCSSQLISFSKFNSMLQVAHTIRQSTVFCKSNDRH